jgi:hypothetical protein
MEGQNHFLGHPGTMLSDRSPLFKADFGISRKKSWYSAFFIDKDKRKLQN